MKYRFFSKDGTEYTIIANTGTVEMIQGVHSLINKPNDPFVFIDPRNNKCFMVIPPVPAMPMFVYEMRWVEMEYEVVS